MISRRIRMVCALVIISPGIFCQTFYISNKGSDVNNGLTQANPLRTIATLLSKDPVNGSIINLEKGSVWHESLRLSSKDNITVQSYGSGEQPVLDASDLQDAAWLPYTTGGVSRIWYRNITINTGTNQQPGVWENAATGATPTHLRLQSSVAAVNANPGSFYYEAGKLYVSTYAGTAPAENEVSVAIRDQALILGDNAVVNGITTQRNLYNDGSLVVGLHSIVKNCTILDGSKHNMLIGSGLVEDCNISGQGYPDDYGGAYSAVGFFFTGNSSETATLRRVKAVYQWGVNVNATLTTAHANSGGFFSLITLDEVTAIGFGGIYGNAPRKIIQTNSTFTDCRSIVAGGVDTLLSLNNIYNQTSSGLWGYILPFEIFSGQTNLESTNDLFYGTPNTGMGFITVSEAGVGSTITLRNPRFIFSDSAIGKAMLRFDCACKLTMKGGTCSGGSRTTLCINGWPGMRYDLSDNFYPDKRSFSIEGLRTNFEEFKSVAGQDLNSVIFQRIIPLSGPNDITGPWMITRADSSVVIKANAGSTSPAFFGAATAYTATVSRETGKISSIPAIEEITTIVKVNGSTIASGATSQPISLNGGKNAITTSITANTGIEKRYIITVIRLSSDLSALGISAGSLSPAFSPSIQSYITTVSNATSFLTLVPVAADTTAVVKVNGIALAGGSISQQIPLSVGNTPLTITVTAQDGVEKTYTIMVTRLPDSKAYTFHIYPNPSKGLFFINLQSLQMTNAVINLVIIDQTGSLSQSLPKIPFSGTSVSIPVNSQKFAKGNYWVIVEINGERIIRRQVIL